MPAVTACTAVMALDAMGLVAMVLAMAVREEGAEGADAVGLKRAAQLRVVVGRVSRAGTKAVQERPCDVVRKKQLKLKLCCWLKWMK